MKSTTSRMVALAATLIGGAGALALMLREGRNTPRFLLVLFVFWTASPYVALAWANLVSKRWSPLTRTTLHWVTLLITLVSLPIYDGLVRPPAGSANAFMFVAVPPASLLLIAIVLSIAALVSRRRRSTGAETGGEHQHERQ